VSTIADDPILDAARAAVLDFGVRRTTVIEVARRAGLSRMTVYRRYPDGEALIRELMAREFGALIERAQADAEGANGRERAVAAAVRVVELLQENPVALRLLELEPELLLPYLAGEPGRVQRLAREVMREAIEAGQAEGSIRGGDPATMAEAVELGARGYVFAVRTPQDRARALGELRSMLDAYLRPG
jgi:AcrR family transcriptional regulator